MDPEKAAGLPAKSRRRHGGHFGQTQNIIVQHSLCDEESADERREWVTHNPTGPVEGERTVVVSSWIILRNDNEIS